MSGKVGTNDALKGLTTAYKQLEKAAGRDGRIKVADIQDPQLKSLAKSVATERISTTCGSTTRQAPTVSLDAIEERIRNVAREIQGADKNGDKFVTPSERKELSNLSNQMLDWAAAAGGSRISAGLSSDARVVDAVSKTLEPIASFKSNKKVTLEMVKGNKLLETVLRVTVQNNLNKRSDYVSSGCGTSSRPPRMSLEDALAKGAPAADVRETLLRAQREVLDQGKQMNTLTDAKQALLNFFEPPARPAPRPRRPDPIVPSGC